MPINPALGRPRQEDHYNFEVTLNYASTRSSRDTQQNFLSSPLSLSLHPPSLTHTWEWGGEGGKKKERTQHAKGNFIYNINEKSDIK